MANRPLLVVLCLMLSAVPTFGEDKFFNSNGVQIRYVDEGVGDPIILLHGFAGSIDRWTVDTRIFETLRKQYRVIAFDSRGNRLSGKPHNPEAYGLEMARDALRLLDHLKVQRSHFIGFSFGGNVVAKLLTSNPERFLTATIGGTAGARVEDPKAVEQYALEITRGDFRGLITRTASTGAPPPTEEAIRSRSEAITATSDNLALAAMVRGRPALAVTEAQLTLVRVPTLAIIGSLDPSLERVRSMKNAMPSLQLVVIEGAAHGPTLRHADFLRSVESFIAGQKISR